MREELVADRAAVAVIGRDHLRDGPGAPVGELIDLGFRVALGREDRCLVDRSAIDSAPMLDIGEFAGVEVLDGNEGPIFALGSAVVLLRNVAQVIDVIGVVAEPAPHRVVTGAALDLVGAVVADDDVMAGIAGQLDVGGPFRGQILHPNSLEAQIVIDCRMDDIGITLAEVLLDDISEIIDPIFIVAGAAFHDVGASPSIESILA